MWLPSTGHPAVLSTRGVQPAASHARHRRNSVSRGAFDYCLPGQTFRQLLLAEPLQGGYWSPILQIKETELSENRADESQTLDCLIPLTRLLVARAEQEGRFAFRDAFTVTVKDFLVQHSEGSEWRITFGNEVGEGAPRFLAPSIPKDGSQGLSALKRGVMSY